MFDFAEAFGGNTKEAYSRLTKIDEEKSQADLAYLEGEFQGSYNKMAALLKEIRELEDLAMEIKDKALLWTYFTEWLVVTATMLLSGSAVWHIMVKRKLYRETKTTRFG